jgi:hypothetical protein
MGHATPVFTSVSPSPSSRAAILLGPFLKWPAFPASQYYGPSAPPRPDQRAMHPPEPMRRWRRRSSGRAGTVPTFIRKPFDGIGTQLCPCTIATTTPQAFTVASPTSDFTQPRSSPTAPRGSSGARCDPTHVRQVSGRWFSLEERSAADSSRMPLRLASPARPIWQYWDDSSLSRTAPPTTPTPR